MGENALKKNLQKIYEETNYLSKSSVNIDKDGKAIFDKELVKRINVFIDLSIAKYKL